MLCVLFRAEFAIACVQRIYRHVFLVQALCFNEGRFLGLEFPIISSWNH